MPPLNVPPLFSEPEIKIGRARKHFAELEAEIAAFIATRPAKFDMRIVDPTVGRQRVEVYFHLERLPPPELGAIVGNVIHNLRSALDLTACDLVRAAEGAEANVGSVYFSILPPTG
jgi:hypothetical protein